MLLKNYRVFVTDESDGMITFIKDEILNKILIPNSNTIAKEIFDKYHNQLSAFKYRYAAVAKFIIRDIRKEGYVFKVDHNNPTLYIPVHKDQKAKVISNGEPSEQEKLFMFYHNLEVIKKRLASNTMKYEY